MTAQPEQYQATGAESPFAHLHELAGELAAPIRLRQLPPQLLQQYGVSPGQPGQSPQPVEENRTGHPLFRRALVSLITSGVVLGSVAYLSSSAEQGSKKSPNITTLAPDTTPIRPTLSPKLVPAHAPPAKPEIQKPIVNVAGTSYVHRVYTEANRGNLPTDIYLPPTTKPMPVVFYVPGRGSYRQPDFGNISNYERLLRTIASEGYVGVAVQSPDYKQGLTDAKAKAQSLDIANVIHRLGQDPQLKGRADLTKIAVIGNSDGGETVLSAGFDPSVKIAVQLVIPLSGALAAGAYGGYGPNVVSIAGTDDGINHPGTTKYLGSLHAQSLQYILVTGMGHYKQLINPPFISPLDGYNYTATENSLLKAALDQFLKNKANEIIKTVGLLGNRVQDSN